MSELLKRWINTDVKLSKEVTDFEQDFANGILIAELVHKATHGVALRREWPAMFMVGDEHGDRNDAFGETTDAKINNFSRLERALRGLDIKLTPKMANDIIDQRKGAAAQLLFRIKAAIDVTELNQGPSLATMSRATSGGGPVLPPLSQSTAGAMGVTRSASAVSTRSRLMGENSFEEILRRTTAEVALQQAASAPGGRGGPKRPSTVKILQEAAANLNSTSTTTTDLGATGGRRTRGSNAQVAPVAPAVPPFIGDEIELAATASTVQDMRVLLRDIDKFESTPTPKQTQLTSSLTSSESSTPRKSSVSIDRSDREKRRRQTLARMEQTIHDTEQLEREREMVKMVKKMGQGETSLEQRKAKLNGFGDRAQHNFAVALQEMKYSRMRDWDNQMKRNQEMLLRAQVEYESKVCGEHERLEMRRLEKQKALKEELRSTCSSIVADVIGLTEVVCGHRALADEVGKGVPLPAQEMKEWKHLFVHSLPLPRLLLNQMPQEQPDQQQQQPTATEEQIEEHQLVEYLEGKGVCGVPIVPVSCDDSLPSSPQSQPTTPSSTTNSTLERCLMHLKSISCPAVVTEKPAKLPKQMIGVCVVGKKYSGRTVLSQQLASRFNLQYIKGDGLDAVQVAELIHRHAVECGESGSGGWIVDGFPQTAQQSAELEKLLSGYEPPQILQPDSLNKHVRTTKQLELTPQIIPASMSVVHAEQLQLQKQPVKSSVDVMIKLDITNELALRRLFGRRTDPRMDNQEFHLEFNPPDRLSESIRRLNDLVALPASAVDELRDSLLKWEDDECELVKWQQQKFMNLVCVDGSQSPQSVVSNAAVPIEQILAAKKAEEDALIAELAAKQQAEEAAAAKQAAEEAAAAAAAAATTLATQQQQPLLPPPTASSLVSPRPTSSVSPRTLAQPPPPIPVVVVEPVTQDPELAKALFARWGSFEMRYLEGLWAVLAGLRNEHVSALRRWSSVFDFFTVFLSKPPVLRQSLVDAFQKEFNDLDRDLRSDNDSKSYLHLRCEELLEQMTSISDKEKELADTERKLNAEDGWLESRTTSLVVLMISLAALEADRYTESFVLLRDYYVSFKAGKPLMDQPPAIDVLKFLPQSLCGATSSSNVASSGDLASGGRLGGKSAGKSTGNASRGSTNVGLVSKPKQTQQPAKLNSTVTGGGGVGGSAQGTKKKQPATNSAAHDGARTPDDMLPELTAVFSSITPFTYTVPEGLLGAGNESETKQVNEALSNQAEMLNRRLRNLRHVAETMVRHLQLKSVAMFSKLDSWVATRHHKETDSATNFINFAHFSIEEEKKLLNRVTAVGPLLCMDPRCVVALPDPPLARLAVSEPLYDYRFGTSQLRTLAEMFSHVSSATSAAIHLNDFTEVLQKCDAMAYQGEMCLPLKWANRDKAWYSKIGSMFAVALDQPPVPQQQLVYVNWRLFMMCVGVLNVTPKVSDASLESLARSMAENSNQTTRLIKQEEFQRLPFWFSQSPGINEWWPATDLGDAEVFARVLVHTLFFMFKGDSQSLVLTLCCNQDKKHGLELAFKMSQIMAEVWNQPLDLYKLFYPFHVPLDSFHPYTLAEAARREAFDAVVASLGPISTQMTWEEFAMLPGIKDMVVKCSSYSLISPLIG